MTTAKVTRRGTAENPIFDFELPMGPKGEPGGWTMGTNLGSSANGTALNLNDVRTPGLYWQGSTGTITSGEYNYPPSTDINGSVRGILEVAAWSGSSGGVIQRYTTIGTGQGGAGNQRPREIWTRTYETGGWGTWVHHGAVQQVTDANGIKAYQTWDDKTNAWVTVSGPGGLANGANLALLDLNLVTTPGIYFQNLGSRVTAANNYPVTTHCGSLTVTQWGTGTTGEVIQTYQTYPNQGSTNTFGIFTRAKRGETWSPWRHMPTQRVDQTAGRAIYTWDEINNREQMIYGDTGKRIVTDWVSPEFNATIAKVRRVNSEVELQLQLNKPSGLVGATIPVLLNGLPAGFRNQHTIMGFTGGTGGYQYTLNYNGASMSLGNVVTAASSVFILVKFSTTDPWPTTLPGTADGGVPAT